MKYNVYYTMPVTFCIEVFADSEQEALEIASTKGYDNENIDSIDTNNVTIDVELSE